MEGGFCLLPTWVLAPPGTQPLPGRFEGGQTQVWTNYRSLRVGCCRAGPGPVPGHACFPTSAHPHPLQRSGFLGKPGQHPHAGLALAAVSAFAEKLREAKSFSFHLVRPARLPWHSGTRKRRRAFAIWGGGKRSSAGKGQGLWQNGPSRALQTSPGGKNAVLGKCRALATVAAPPHQLPPPQQGQNHLQGHFHQLSSQQAEATSLFPVAWLCSGWKPPKLSTCSLLDTKPR